MGHLNTHTSPLHFMDTKRNEEPTDPPGFYNKYLVDADPLKAMLI